MLKSVRLVLACVLCATLAAFSPRPAAAQVAGTATLPTSNGQLRVIALGYRASRLLRSDVYNIQGQRIGRVDDMVVTQDAAVSYFILEVGGFLRIGQKQVAVPARAFKIVNHKLVLPDMTADSLKRLPAFRFSTL